MVGWAEWPDANSCHCSDVEPSMKKPSYVLLALAAFGGVFGALRLESVLEHNEASAHVFSPAPATPLLSGVATNYADTLGGPPDFRAAAKRVLPSVVSVDRFDDVQDFFGDSEGVQETGTGSGVIIDSNGTIITNNHVVQNAVKVQVRLSDHRSFTAKVLGTDPLTDLAVIKVNANDLPPISLADSSQVEVGQWVMAVGNPLGYSGTLSVGVVSSLGRDLQTQESYLTDAIQTDAAINQGNSGGALTDAQGRLIGINSAIASTSGGSIGIGFAIPVNRVKTVAKDIIELGHARHAGLGAEFDPRFDQALESAEMRDRLTQAYGMQVPDHGVIIHHVHEGSSAAQAGMQDYDIILSVNGKPVHSQMDVSEAFTDLRPGETVGVRFWSKGSVKDATVKLEEVVAQ